MPKSMAGTLASWSHLIPIRTLRAVIDIPSFQIRKREAKRDTLICPRLYGYSMTELGFQLDLTLLKSLKSQYAGHVTSPLFLQQQAMLTVLEDQLDGDIQLGKWDSQLESQMFTQARGKKKKSDDWLSKLILIFSTFHFHLISLILVGKNDSTRCLLLILQKWPLLCGRMYFDITNVHV